MFEEILECNLEIPSDIDPDVEDLILCLLRTNPNERLGAGDKGSGNDIDALKRHKFFSGYAFEKVHQSVPPISSILQTETDDDSLSDHRIDDINMVLDNIQL